MNVKLLRKSDCLQINMMTPFGYFHIYWYFKPSGLIPAKSHKDGRVLKEAYAASDELGRPRKVPILQIRHYEVKCLWLGIAWCSSVVPEIKPINSE